MNRPMSVGAGEWDSVLGEVLAVEKRRRVEEGEGSVAEYIDWMLRQILEEQPTEEPRETHGKAREHSP